MAARGVASARGSSPGGGSPRGARGPRPRVREDRADPLAARGPHRRGGGGRAQVFTVRERPLSGRRRAPRHRGGPEPPRALSPRPPFRVRVFGPDRVASVRVLLLPPRRGCEPRPGVQGGDVGGRVGGGEGATPRGGAPGGARLDRLEPLPERSEARVAVQGEPERHRGRGWRGGV